MTFLIQFYSSSLPSCRFLALAAPPFLGGTGQFLLREEHVPAQSTPSRNGTWPSERTCPLESNRHKWVLTWEWPNLEKIENQKNSENTSPAFLGHFNCCLPECNGCEYVTDIWLQGIVVTRVLRHGASDSRRQELVEGDGLHLPDENFPGILEDFFVLCLSQMRNRKKKRVDAKN